MLLSRVRFAVAACLALTGCGSSSSDGAAPPGAGGAGATTGGGAGGSTAQTGGSAGTSASSGNGGTSGFVDSTPTAQSAIRHVVVIVQENHTFDSYFGNYCTAPTGTLPTCEDGPGCCEAAPTIDPGTSGKAPTVLDDAATAAYDPNHTDACEEVEMDGGKMDHYVDAPTCGDARNFAVAPASVIQPYWDLATNGAIADRYFQPISGQSSSNDMYFARADYVFTDNAADTKSIGSACSLTSVDMQYTDTTIGDLLVSANVPWSAYIEGYQVMLDAYNSVPTKCPKAPADCAFKLGFYPCIYDPSDIPFQYYPNFQDNPTYMRDYAKLASDVAAGQLPSFSYVKALGYHQEHPGYKSKITDGITFVQGVISTIESSPYAASTLILLTYDEGGGYFDHVAPPANNPIDGKPYGTRIPITAIGPFARKGHVSHVQMEHSSIVKFLEWNWLAGQTGQLGTRDTNVANIGSLLDATATVTAVPED